MCKNNNNTAKQIYRSSFHAYFVTLNSYSIGILSITDVQMSACLVLGSLISKQESDSQDVRITLDLVHAWLEGNLEDIDMPSGTLI